MVSAPSKVFRGVQRSPYFPDISVFLHLKTLQTPLRIFLLGKHGFPPPRSRQSCWCPPGLCTLVWTGLPPAGTAATHILAGWIPFTSTMPIRDTNDGKSKGNYFSEEIKGTFKKLKMSWQHHVCCQLALRNWEHQITAKYAEFWQF